MTLREVSAGVLGWQVCRSTGSIGHTVRRHLGDLADRNGRRNSLRLDSVGVATQEESDRRERMAFGRGSLLSEPSLHFPSFVLSFVTRA